MCVLKMLPIETPFNLYSCISGIPKLVVAVAVESSDPLVLCCLRVFLLLLFLSKVFLFYLTTFGSANDIFPLFKCLILLIDS